MNLFLLFLPGVLGYSCDLTRTEYQTDCCGANATECADLKHSYRFHCCHPSHAFDHLIGKFLCLQTNLTYDQDVGGVMFEGVQQVNECFYIHKNGDAVFAAHVHHGETGGSIVKTSIVDSNALHAQWMDDEFVPFYVRAPMSIYDHALHPINPISGLTDPQRQMLRTLGALKDQTATSPELIQFATDIMDLKLPQRGRFYECTAFVPLMLDSTFSGVRMNNAIAYDTEKIFFLDPTSLEMHMLDRIAVADTEVDPPFAKALLSAFGTHVLYLSTEWAPLTVYDEIPGYHGLPKPIYTELPLDIDDLQATPVGEDVRIDFRISGGWTWGMGHVDLYILGKKVAVLHENTHLLTHEVLQDNLMMQLTPMWPKMTVTVALGTGHTLYTRQPLTTPLPEIRGIYASIDILPLVNASLTGS